MDPISLLTVVDGSMGLIGKCFKVVKAPLRPHRKIQTRRAGDSLDDPRAGHSSISMGTNLCKDLYL